MSYFAPLEFIEPMSRLALLDRFTLYKASVALAKPPEEWPSYPDYDPQCHAPDAQAAILLSYICDKVYILNGIDAALLKRRGVSYEVTQTVAAAKAIPQIEFAKAAITWLKEARGGEESIVEELVSALPVKSLEDDLIRLLYAMGALDLSATVLTPSRQLALIAYYARRQ